MDPFCQVCRSFLPLKCIYYLVWWVVTPSIYSWDFRNYGDGNEPPNWSLYSEADFIFIWCRLTFIPFGTSLFLELHSVCCNSFHDSCAYHILSKILWWHNVIPSSSSQVYFYYESTFFNGNQNWSCWLCFRVDISLHALGLCSCTYHIASI